MDMLGFFLDRVLKARYEEDLVDRINYRYTSWLLIGSAILLSARQYVGKPIKCWVPMQFRPGWEAYAEDYCYVENTYWLPFERQIPEDHGERDEQMLAYYQWVPFVLALQALMFNVPHMLWRMLNFLSGIQVRTVVAMACKHGLKREQNKGLCGMVALHLREGLTIEKFVSRNSNPLAWLLRIFLAARGVYVTGLYILMKVLNVVNLILQFYLLSAFIGSEYSWWGLRMLADIANGVDWFQTGHFPRVTLCDFEIRQLGNIHRWSIQCVLMINMFNEKVYVYLWWHMFILTVITVGNLVVWTFYSVMPGPKRDFIQRLLNAQTLVQDYEYDELSNFISSYLQADGITVLRLIAHNAGDMVASDVAAHLWIMYKKDQQGLPGYDTATRPTAL